MCCAVPPCHDAALPCCALLPCCVLSACRWDVKKLEPLVAAPHSPDNRKTARECSDVKIDRVYIGSCTGVYCWLLHCWALTGLVGCLALVGTDRWGCPLGGALRGTALRGALPRTGTGCCWLLLGTAGTAAIWGDRPVSGPWLVTMGPGGWRGAGDATLAHAACLASYMMCRQPL